MGSCTDRQLMLTKYYLPGLNQRRLTLHAKRKRAFGVFRSWTVYFISDFGSDFCFISKPIIQLKCF